MNKVVTSFVEFFTENKNVSDKNTLIQLAKDQFHLIKDRKVFYCDFFAARFCYSATGSFSNTVLGLSMLQKYDHIPFFVILVCRNGDNKLYLANSSFLNKISHSSQNLSVDNIVAVLTAAIL